MHLVVLLVVATVLAWDSGLRPFGDDGAFGAPWVGALVAVGMPVAMLVCAMAIARPQRDGRHRPGAVRRVDRLLRIAPWTALIGHVVASLALGWITAVRAVVGDTVLLDEVIAALPPLLAIIAVWWGTWPVERVVREWAIIARLDRSASSGAPEIAPGAPVTVAMPRRGTVIWNQIRAQMLLVLVPVVAAMGIAESARKVVDAHRPEWSLGAEPWIPLVAVGSAVVVAPLLVRWCLGLRSLPRGPMRDELEEVCAIHRVRVRDILVWGTGHTMLNGAVIGLFGRLRYILLTDALIDTLPRRMLLAVMAHEIGHVRRHHLPWLGAAAIASLWIGSAGAWYAAGAIIEVLPPVWSAGIEEELVIAFEVILGLGVAVALIGWVSRRLEWQADAFAAVHLSGAGAAHVDDEASDSVCAALEMVTVAAGGDPAARSWRHGSIRARQRRLQSLAGRPVRRLAVDRSVGRLKIAIAAIVMLAGLSMLLAPRDSEPSADRAPAESISATVGRVEAAVRGIDT